MPGESVDTGELVDLIVESLRVLRVRDGVDVEDELLLDRARNLAMALAGNYRIERLANPSTEPCTGLNARNQRRDELC